MKQTKDKAKGSDLVPEDKHHLFDGMDCRPPGESAPYKNPTMPEWMRKMLAEKDAKS